MTTPERSIAETPVGAWLERLAEPSPAPGGGAAAGLVLAAGAALGAMAAGYAPDQDVRDPAIGAFDHARAEALRSADADAAVSAALADAYRLPADDPDRPARIQETMLDAARSAVALALVALPLVPVLDEVATRGRPTLLPDVAVAAQLLAAGVRGCAATLRSDASAAEEAGAAARAVAPWRQEERRLVALADELAAVAGRVTDAL